MGQARELGRWRRTSPPSWEAGARFPQDAAPRTRTVLAEMNNSIHNPNGASHEHLGPCPRRRPVGAWAGGEDRAAVRAGRVVPAGSGGRLAPVSYTHLRAHETDSYL